MLALLICSQLFHLEDRNLQYSLLWFTCSFEIGFFPLLLRDHNTSTSNLMHVFCYGDISENVISLAILTNITFLHPSVVIYVFNFSLVFNHLFVIFHIFFGKYTLMYLLPYLLLAKFLKIFEMDWVLMTQY